MIRVLLADDQSLIREGFRMMLEAEPDIQVVGEAKDGAEALTRIAQLDPDVVLMDIRMPDLDGIEATRRLVASGSRTKVIVLTTFDLDELVYRAMKAGASAYLLKDGTRDRLVSAVRQVVDGESLLSPAITRRLIEDYCARPEPDQARSATANLSEREVEVATLIARGMSNAEIGEELCLAQPTVKSHVARILTKLDLRDRVQVVVFAYESGLVRPGT